MPTHILTVNKTTFPVHLQYMFLGTGKGYTNDGDTYAKNNNMMADILGVRNDDNIIFYVQEVGFFGVFKAHGTVFRDETDYLDTELGSKRLSFRCLIKATNQIYSNPVSEWDMMENPENVMDKSILNMQWSWIFKKMNASRGCLTIDDEEAKLMINIISKNNTLLAASINYNFNSTTNKIEVLNNASIVYNQTLINVPCKHRYDNIKSENDLKIFLITNIGSNGLEETIVNQQQNGNITFLANEVLCSFSERKMDLVLGTNTNKCILIELKNKFDYDENIYNQLKEYARWMSAYRLQYNSIIPVLIIKAASESIPKRRGSRKFKYLSQSDKDSSQCSKWYNDILDNLHNLIPRLKNENISLLEELQIFTFKTNDNGYLDKFERLL